MDTKQTARSSNEERDLLFQTSQLFARQTQGIDEGDISSYSETFGINAVVVNTVTHSRLTGRSAIHTTAERNFARRRNAQRQSRHMMFTQSTRTLSDGLVSVSSRVLILDTPHQGATSVIASVVCDDVISHDSAGEPLIQFRTISPFG